MRKWGRGLLVASAAVLAGAPAGAQELVHTFINPAFGGNPFNSDHLIATATAQRPDRRTSGSGSTAELTESQLFARQIQSRLLSALSSSVVEAITGADPGTSGEFTVGDQTIFFERTLSAIRLRITDNSTGETTEIVVPQFNLTAGGTGAQTGSSASASQAGTLIGSLEGGALESGTLEGGAIEAGSPSGPGF